MSGDEGEIISENKNIEKHPENCSITKKYYLIVLSLTNLILLYVAGKICAL